MTIIKRNTFWAIIALLSVLPLFSLAETMNKTKPAMATKKIVIAHRGASGYLPEHTLAAKAMAFAMGADYIEQDLVLTKDNRLVVLHDHYLDGVTNVAAVFPDKKRTDGRYYAIDFTLAEIKQLKVTEAFSVKDGKQVANFPQRFPLWKSDFSVPTFEEEIELIQGLNKSMNRNIGIYTEIKAPWFHHQEGKDIAKETLKVLNSYGYNTRDSKVFLQSFDFNEIKRIKTELLPALKMDIKLVQLLAETDWKETYEKQGDSWVNYNYDWMFTQQGISEMAKYVDGIGPWAPMIVSDKSTPNNLIISDIVKNAHNANLVVHPYTFRLDKGKIPSYAKDFDDLLDIFYNKADVDGVFTDFPDQAVKFLMTNKQ